MGIKLNLGAGHANLEGYVPIDRMFGSEVYPLPQYSDGSVEEIRASHILEHLKRDEVRPALREWRRVLEPNGVIKIAVPDFDQIMKRKSDPLFECYLFGGQSDENDCHYTMWDRDKLSSYLYEAGFRDVQPWVLDTNEDTANLDVSLNLMARKDSEADPKPEEPKSVKVTAVMSLPRYGSLAARNVIERAFHVHGIPIVTTQGVFWGQCMQRMFEGCVEGGIDFILTVDFDTMLTPQDISKLLLTIAHRDEIDALAALEPRRNNDRPLMTIGTEQEVMIGSGFDPIKVTTAHFGLTAIRVEALVDMPKPWFFGQPTSEGLWDNDSPEKMDDDIWFWHQWRKHGKNIYVDPGIRIGHLEETVAYYDKEMELHRVSVPEWRKRFLGID